MQLPVLGSKGKGEKIQPPPGRTLVAAEGERGAR